jgi:hypothetical protein
MVIVVTEGYGECLLRIVLCDDETIEEPFHLQSV